jgi:hypothetical protein
LKIVETRPPSGWAGRASIAPDRVSMWMPCGPKPWDDWLPVRLAAKPLTTVGDVVVVQGDGVRFGVPRDLVCGCSDAFASGYAGWVALPAWYVRLLGVDDAVWV